MKTRKITLILFTTWVALVVPALASAQEIGSDPDGLQVESADLVAVPVMITHQSDGIVALYRAKRHDWVSGAYVSPSGNYGFPEGASFAVGVIVGKKGWGEGAGNLISPNADDGIAEGLLLQIEPGSHASSISVGYARIWGGEVETEHWPKDIGMPDWGYGIKAKLVRTYGTPLWHDSRMTGIAPHAYYAGAEGDLTFAGFLKVGLGAIRKLTGGDPAPYRLTWSVGAGF